MLEAIEHALELVFTAGWVVFCIALVLAAILDFLE